MNCVLLSRPALQHIYVLIGVPSNQIGSSSKPINLVATFVRDQLTLRRVSSERSSTSISRHHLPRDTLHIHLYTVFIQLYLSVSSQQLLKKALRDRLQSPSRLQSDKKCIQGELAIPPAVPTMAPASSSDVPAFYKFYFLWSDPAVCLWAVYMDFFTPDVVVNAFIPASIAPRNPQFDFLLQQLGGSLLMLGFLDVVLLRYTKDVMIWKILQAATLLYDIVLLYSVYDALEKQGRLSVDRMRLAEDWGGLAITGLAVVVRSAFLLDVGMAGGKAKGEKRK